MPDATRSRTFAPLRNRNFALLWTGQTVSTLGDGIFTVALAIVTLDIDHSPSGIAYVFAARAIPSVLLALVGGVVVDRVSSRLVMITSDTLRGLAVGLTAILISRGELHLWELAIMAAIFGAADSFFGPASMTIVPEIVDTELLVPANALSQMNWQLTQNLIGPAIGGIVVASIGTSWSFGFDAISFFVSCLGIALMRHRTQPRESSSSPLTDAKEGLRYVIERRWLLYTICAAALANFFGLAPISVLLPLFVRETLHASAFSLGMVFAAGGAAGIIASLIVARLGSPKNRMTVLWIAYAIGGLAGAARAFAPNPLVTAIFTALEVGFVLYGDVVWTSNMQELVPREFLGRVSSLVYLFAFSLGPLGILMGGGVATAIGVRQSLFFCGILAFLVCIVVPFFPSVRAFDRVGVMESAEEWAEPTELPAGE